MELEEKFTLLKEFFDSVQDAGVKKFMEQCIKRIPEYWFEVPASSTGKYHPSYSQGHGGLMRHSIALLRILNCFSRNTTFIGEMDDKAIDLLRVACLMHDSMKSGSDEQFKINKFTCFLHPILAADLVRSIETSYISKNEQDFIADAIESHMGQWNSDHKGKSRIRLPLPETTAQKLLHLVDYIAAQKCIELNFEPKEEPSVLILDIDTYTLDFGKYKGRLLKDVARYDPKYVKWLHTLKSEEILQQMLTHIRL